jgi:hypothetical protein
VLRSDPQHSTAQRARARAYGLCASLRRAPRRFALTLLTHGRLRPFHLPAANRLAWQSTDSAPAICAARRQNGLAQRLALCTSICSELLAVPAQNFWHHLRSRKRNISINIDLDMFRFEDLGGKMCTR